MLQSFIRQYGGVNPSHHHLHALPAIGVPDLIGSLRKFSHDGDTHQICAVIHIVGSKRFLDNCNRVAGRSKRRQEWKIHPLQRERAGYSVRAMFMRSDKSYFHLLASYHWPTGLETPHPVSGGADILFTT